MDLENVISEAVRQSQKTSYIFRLGAVVFNRHRIISGGYNRIFSQGNSDTQGNCAELLAIRKSPSKLLKGASILVCRVNPSGTFGMSKPCAKCQKLIIKSGIIKVIYSTPTGWETWNPNESK